jgi:serine/threonine-protein kinase
MLVGQQLGPFRIEKELGSGAMGAVYRAVDTKTGQKVAIKVMSPALASEPRARARFEREAAILKQLKHPNIVRRYGVGKHQGMLFCIMEYVEGESLDRLLARRIRLTWEEVAALGQQLCAALQHAHNAGIIHRDLKPSNLMVLEDGERLQLKLTDFGIAKDLDVTQLTEANCTVGTAAYMSPEQCRGERDLKPKSDLYSLGIVFYELLTGRKPFSAENAMEMFMKHVQGTFERPAKIVLDIPVGLDNLVCQLLEKKPEQRPLDANKVAEALCDIQEKVETLRSAGVDAARTRRGDRPRGQAKPDEKDKEAARSLLGKRSRGKKKKQVPFYQTIWFQAAGLVALLLGVVLMLLLFLGPPSARKLYEQAEKLMKSRDPEDWEKARNGPIKAFLNHHANRPEAQQVRGWLDKIEDNDNEKLLHNYVQKKKGPIKVQSQSDAERDAFAAFDAEEDGDLKKAKELWEAMAKTYQGGSGYAAWGRLAGNHVKYIEEIEDLKRSFKNKYDDAVERLGVQPYFNSDQEKEAFLGYRYERFGDPVMARKTFKDLKEKYADKPDQRAWFLLAASKERDLDRLSDKGRDRAKIVADKLAEADQGKDPEKIRATCKNIVFLYDGEEEEDIKKTVEAAKKRLEALGVKP